MLASYDTEGWSILKGLEKKYQVWGRGMRKNVYQATHNRSAYKTSKPELPFQLAHDTNDRATFLYRNIERNF
jgi:hypothetical protein